MVRSRVLLSAIFATLGVSRSPVVRPPSPAVVTTPPAMPLLCAEHNTDGQLVAVSIPLAPTSEPSQATNPAMPPQVTSPVVTLTSPPGCQLGGFFLRRRRFAQRAT